MEALLLNLTMTQRLKSKHNKRVVNNLKMEIIGYFTLLIDNCMLKWDNKHSIQRRVKDDKL